jgi:hypothetical protein
MSLSGMVGIYANGAQKSSRKTLPKRIEILHGSGQQSEAEKLLPQRDSYDIRELYTECKKAAGKGGVMI